jgi:hypothetical protein
MTVRYLTSHADRLLDAKPRLWDEDAHFDVGRTRL